MSGGSPRIIAGAWRGRKLVVPDGMGTRPTNARARQAAFDILVHANWGGAGFLQTAKVLDGFAGCGAFGLEALSRGAVACTFMENSKPALAAIAANVAACRAENVARVVAADVLAPPAGTPHDLVFLDPPYGAALVPRAVAALAAQGWLAPGGLVMAELGPEDAFAPAEILVERRHGKARLVFFRLPS